MSSGDGLTFDVSHGSGQPREVWVHRVDGHKVTIPRVYCVARNGDWWTIDHIDAELCAMVSVVIPAAEVGWFTIVGQSTLATRPGRATPDSSVGNEQRSCSPSMLPDGRMAPLHGMEGLAARARLSEAADITVEHEPLCTFRKHMADLDHDSCDPGCEVWSCECTFIRATYDRVAEAVASVQPSHCYKAGGCTACDALAEAYEATVDAAVCVTVSVALGEFP